MKPSAALKHHRAAIIEIVERHHATNPRVFGSVLHGQDTESSDLDLLIDPTAETTLFDLARIQMRLQSLLGIQVDLRTPKDLPACFREQVIREARPL
jgi:hypothetical protein